MTTEPKRESTVISPRKPQPFLTKGLFPVFSLGHVVSEWDWEPSHVAFPFQLLTGCVISGESLDDSLPQFPEGSGEMTAGL